MTLVAQTRMEYFLQVSIFLKVFLCTRSLFYTRLDLVFWFVRFVNEAMIKKSNLVGKC